MKLIKYQNIISVKDGEQFSIIVELEPSVKDPALEQPGVSQTYRVVANSWGPTLDLAPLAKNPSILTDLGKLQRTDGYYETVDRS
jgi:hypothetical protein